MVCGGHAGRAHRKILEKRQKMKPLPKNTSKSMNPLFLTCLKMGVNAKVIGQGVGALVMLYTKSTHVFHFHSDGRSVSERVS